MDFIIAVCWLWITDHNLEAMVLAVIHQSEKNISVDNFDRGRAGMRNILAENERQNNSRGSGISVSASSSGPRYSRSQSRYNVDLRQGLVDD